MLLSLVFSNLSRSSKHVPSMMIARAIIDDVGSAPNVARRHLHRGQFRILEPVRLEMQP
jgi:hypothetical protein